VDDSAGWRAEASSGFSGALYDGSGRDAASAVGAPQSPPPPRAFVPPSAPFAAVPSVPAPAVDPSAWWSNAATDPWRDPDAPTAIVIDAPAPPDDIRPPDFTPRRRAATLGQVLLISVVAALLAGALGGALGYVAAVKGGVAKTDVLGSGGGTAPALAQRAPTSLAGVVKAVLPSVVTVRVDEGAGEEAIGSGFIVTTDGYVITNDHVIDGLTGNATITFSDSTTAPAKLVGTDPESDIAVLKLDRTGLPAITFGDSDSVAVGDPVLAVGAPLDLPGTVTYGIISALHRPLEIGSAGGPTRYYAAIQTDAAVNHGNSGGPLFDASGKVIGVDAVIKSVGSNDEDTGSIGLAFAIPIDEARRVAEQIIDTGKVTHTVIGATAATAYDQNPDGGVPVGTVSPHGPADNAGIQPGDVIMSIGGSPLTTSGDLIALVRSYAPGAIVPVIYTRDGVSHTAEVKLIDGG
jgi:putative serine protease PepD